MKNSLIIIALLLIAFQSHAQRILTYNEYIKNVRDKNIEYIVEKYNVSIAEANAQAAKVFPDPELSFSYDNNQDIAVQMGQVFAAELGYTLELGGKRRARMAVAKSEQQMTETLAENFFPQSSRRCNALFFRGIKTKATCRLGFFFLSKHERLGSCGQFTFCAW